METLAKNGAQNVRLETESAVDTMDFVNKIVNGKKPGELPYRSSLPGEQQQQRFADRLDT
jgi:hypothetical protein